MTFSQKIEYSNREQNKERKEFLMNQVKICPTCNVNPVSAKYNNDYCSWKCRKVRLGKGKVSNLTTNLTNEGKVINPADNNMLGSGGSLDLTIANHQGAAPSSSYIYNNNNKQEEDLLGGGKNLTIADLCPRCQSPLVYRKNKKDNHQFIGCSIFPICKYSRDEQQKPVMMSFKDLDTADKRLLPEQVKQWIRANTPRLLETNDFNVMGDIAWLEEGLRWIIEDKTYQEMPLYPERKEDIIKLLKYLGIEKIKSLKQNQLASFLE